MWKGLATVVMEISLSRRFFWQTKPLELKGKYQTLDTLGLDAYVQLRVFIDRASQAAHWWDLERQAGIIRARLIQDRIMQPHQQSTASPLSVTRYNLLWAVRIPTCGLGARLPTASPIAQCVGFGTLEDHSWFQQGSNHCKERDHHEISCG